jgi:ribose transport system substrate-binding protein
LNSINFKEAFMKKAFFATLFLCLGIALFAGGRREAAPELRDINIKPLVDDGSGAILPLMGVGPRGEEPVGVEVLLDILSAEDKVSIREKGYKAAVCLHTTAADWSILQIAGIRAVLEEFNIELIAITDAEMSVEKQISDYESVIGLNPDLMIVFILDADSSEPILRRAVDRGISLAFIDAVPSGFSHPRDYAGMATADNYANGKASAEALVEYLGGIGKVAVIQFISSLFHTDQRTQAAFDVFNANDGIEIVAVQGVPGAVEAATAVENILIANPDIDGIWTVWDAPGMAAVGVIENLNRNVKVVTVDLSEDTAYSIASGGAMLATGAQHPYDQGVAVALIGVASLAGKETPPYVLVPGEKVTRATLKDAWRRVFRTEIPTGIERALSQN